MEPMELADRPWLVLRPVQEVVEMNPKQLSILNSLVTFAAENVPGGLSPEETDVARLVGEWVRGLVPRDENLIFNYKLVNASTGKTMEDVANQWAKHGWRVVGVVSDTRSGYAHSFVLEKPKNDIRTEVIKLEVDLEKIFAEAAGALPQDACELLILIREIEKEHSDNPN